MFWCLLLILSFYLKGTLQPTKYRPLRQCCRHSGLKGWRRTRLHGALCSRAAWPPFALHRRAAGEAGGGPGVTLHWSEVWSLIKIAEIAERRWRVQRWLTVKLNERVSRWAEGERRGRSDGTNDRKMMEGGSQPKAVSFDFFVFFCWRFEELIDYWFKPPGGKTLLELPLPLVGVVSNHLMFTLLEKKMHTRENGGKNNPIWKQFWIIF